MTGKFPKSKLKRKRTSVEDVEPETSTLPSVSGTGGASTGREEPDAAPSAPSAPAWWRTTQPGSVDALWAAALTSALSYERWDPLPDLPPSSAAPKPKNSDQERWCDLRSKVKPVPESSLRTPWSLASSQKDSSGWTTPAPQPDRRPYLHTGSPRPLFRSQPPPGEEASSSSSSSAGQCAGGQKVGPGNQELLTQKVSDPSSPAEEEEEEERGVRGDEEAELQSCPMCLQAFPAGSTQMDRDGHLAQCLSEMNMDMTW